MKKPSPLFSLFLFVVSLAGDGLRAEPFQDGETVCFLGDSITHGRQYHSMVYSYYLTRFPDRKIHFVNAGVSGDSAGGAMRRVEDDVILKSPTTVVVMLGMNDVGRGNYVANPTEQQLAAQAGALERYETNMDALLGRIRDEVGPKYILMTPTPFDQTGVNDLDNNQPGCNNGLAKCAELVRKLATKYDAEVIDLHGPMTAFNLERQKVDPAYTIVGPDRVHPGLPGNVMMAWLILKAQGAPALVSEVEFDSISGKAVTATNATVNDVKQEGAGWSFSVLEGALPWPIDPRAGEILDLLPIVQDLNQEVLRVKGLPEGIYTLSIDGEEVARHTATEWGDGINLAMNTMTPQAKQAVEVEKINERRRQAEVRLRGYAASRWFLGRSIDPDDMEAVKAFMESKKGENGYYLNQIPTYLKEWPNRGEVETLVKELEKKALDARKPVSHNYLIQPVSE